MKLLIKRTLFHTCLIIISYMSIIITSAFADFFPTPTPTPRVCDFLGKITIDNHPANPGDEIAFFDADGNICGHYVIARTGLYGFLHVYATDNETLSVQVWDAKNQKHYTNNQIVLIPGEPAGTALSSQNPPIFIQNARFVLDVTVKTYLMADINRDNILNIVDIIVLLQYLSR